MKSNRIPQKNYLKFAPMILIAIVIFCTGCQQRQRLFNGKDLTGWKLYVDDKTVDPNEIWSVKNGGTYSISKLNGPTREMESPGVIHCAGKPNSYLRTESVYSNYKLHLEWRWVDEPTNSGVLLHASGKDKIWPKSIEAQLKADNAGDLVLIDHTGITVSGIKYHDPKEMFVTVAKRNYSTEKKPGQWNSYDIYCEGDSIYVCVNGKLQNLARKATDTEGWICLQSEGSPIEFRNIYIKHLKVKSGTETEALEDKDVQEEAPETEVEVSEDKGIQDEKKEAEPVQ
jgi:hypothetical protein